MLSSTSTRSWLVDPQAQRRCGYLRASAFVISSLTRSTCIAASSMSQRQALAGVAAGLSDGSLVEPERCGWRACVRYVIIPGLILPFHPGGVTDWAAVCSASPASRRRKAHAPYKERGPGEVVVAGDRRTQLRRLLGAMKAMRDGTFPAPRADRVRVLAELATFYNEIAERQLHLATELERRAATSRAARAGTASACTPASARAAGRRSIEAANSLVDRPGPSHRRVRPRGRRRLRGRPDPADGPARSTASHCGASRCGLATERQRPGRPALVDRRRDHPGDPRGRHRGQARRPGAGAQRRRHAGATCIDAVNTMSSRLTAQVRDIALVTTAVANGDLSRTVTVEVSGEMAAAEGHRRPDGRPAVVVRRRGHPGGPRGRHRGPARRPGRRARRVRAPGRTSPTR